MNEYEAILQELRQQEEEIQFASFTNETALSIGLALMQEANKRSKPVAIDITRIMPLSPFWPYIQSKYTKAVMHALVKHETSKSDQTHGQFGHRSSLAQAFAFRRGWQHLVKQTETCDNKVGLPSWRLSSETCNSSEKRRPHGPFLWQCDWHLAVTKKEDMA